MGLGVSYSEIVSMLYQMCQRGDIAAKFVLQPVDELQKIIENAPKTGRPDTPGQ